MQPIQWKVDKVIDAHTHYRNEEPLAHFNEILDLVGCTKANILGGREAAALDRKRLQPDRFFTFGMLTHDPAKMETGDGEYLAGQIDQLLDWGFDGLKMMEGKPAMRRTWMPLDIDHDYMKPFWDKAAAIDVPITIHVCDPISYWTGAGSNQPQYQDLAPQEDFFRQTEAVLARNPNLRITFAHFLFLGPQLDRLADLFAKYPKMRVDMALGDEFLYFLSDDPDRAREFFITWQDRILYGTDISDRNSIRLAYAKAEMIRRFLETDQTFTSLTAEAMNKPPTVGANGRTELHGLALPTQVLARVLAGNFEAFVGPAPGPVA
jgi:predicted TIM-barrel fold metal-dependent hydrolase